MTAEASTIDAPHDDLAEVVAPHVRAVIARCADSDVGFDVGDVGFDVGPDTGFDARTDTDANVGADTDTDTDAGARADPDADVGADTDPDVRADARAIGPVGSATPGELASHREAMLHFARRRIRDEDLAEDAVQDALAAALANRASFQGQSALRTWLIGILNHKIQDTFRREGRYVPLPEGEGATGADMLDRLAAHLERSDDPAAQVASARLGEALLAEIDALPPTLRSVFVLQVLEGLSTAEVCRRLDITEANCWVRLHRARKRLAQRMRDHLV